MTFSKASGKLGIDKKLETFWEHYLSFGFAWKYASVQFRMIMIIIFPLHIDIKLYDPFTGHQSVDPC